MEDRRSSMRRRMSAFGTKRTFRGRVPMSAFGGKADMRRCLLLTQRWGNRPAFLWIAERLGCCASGMDYFAGLDVSVKDTSVCIVDEAGKIIREVKVASEPDALLAV